MKMSKRQITEKLSELGAAWAVTDAKTVLPNDGFGAKPTYHVHPDASYPHQDSIKRFGNLDELAGYVDARERANQAPDQSAAYEIMEDYWQSNY